MIRELKIQQYSKSTSAFRPEILSSLILLQKKPYDSKTHLFQAFDTVSNTYFQVYISHYIDSQVQKQMEFVRYCPKILLLKYQSYNLILQEKVFQNLHDYFTAYQAKNCPNLSQIQAQGVLKELVVSIQDYFNNQIVYGCVSPKNIVRLNSKWMFSLAGAITKNDFQSKNFYDITKKGQAGIIYAFGTLLFKMIFGFVPFQGKQKKPAEFRLQNYIKYLQQETYKKLLKVYYFSDCILQVSKSCQNLIEKALSGQFKSLNEFKQHPFFTQQIPYHKKSILQSKIQQKNSNRQVKMISYFKKEYHSLIMAAIQRKKKYPFERINSKSEPELSNFLELKETYKKDPFLLNLGFAPQQQLNQEVKDQQKIENLQIPCKYFDGEFQDEDSPCMDLIKFLQQDFKQNPRLYQNEDRQSDIKLYAFPYIMVFQLVKVYEIQNKQIKKCIQQLIKDFLQISTLYPVQKVTLHNTKKKINDFNEIKLAYRQKINSLYKYFLMQAMKRYNNKKQGISMSQKIKLKQEGLQYYKLCLKLMEASVINRKLGKDLDLQRIVTSQRKQIQSDLESLLKTYFPNKVELK